jgi:anti-anti-sigma regulatory factor
MEKTGHNILPFQKEVYIQTVRIGSVMQIDKENPLKWTVEIEEVDNQLGLINTIRYLEILDNEINDFEGRDLYVDLILRKLRSANSEMISQFVIIHQSLVQKGGRLRLVDANPDLKSSFDVVMLDKIIAVNYEGMDESMMDDEDEEEDDDDLDGEE